MSVVTVRFPILMPHHMANYDLVKRCPGSLPWAMVEEHSKQCLSNHGQTVARLAERGGLDPWEAVCVLEDRDERSWQGAVIGPEEIVERLWAIHDEWIRRNP